MTRKVKTSPKIFSSDPEFLESLILRVTKRVSEIVGSTLGPGGKCVLIESDLPNIPSSNTKDGMTVFKSLGAFDAYEHLILNQLMGSAIKVAGEAGDGTTTCSILLSSFIQNLFAYCKKYPKNSPQKVARTITRLLNDKMLPFIEKSSIKVGVKNQDLLEKVARVSANGDTLMSEAVMKAFEITGFSGSSHVTIQELSGMSDKYETSLVEGFPVNRGYEESCGKFHASFINDQGYQRCSLEKPHYVLFDGRLSDPSQIVDALRFVGYKFNDKQLENGNVVIFAHAFTENVLNFLTFNFSNAESAVKAVPVRVPINALINSELNFLMDVSAFTGAKIFDMQNPLSELKIEDLGSGAEKIDIYRFRTTIVGNPDSTNVEVRADELKARIEQSESKLEKSLLEESLGILTSGIAQLKVYGSSDGELKEKADRAEDAVCAVRATIKSGCLPGGGRVLINLALELQKEDSSIIKEVIVPSLFSPIYRLLDNSGHNGDEIKKVLQTLIDDPKLVYDIENNQYDKIKETDVFDATEAVKQALINAVSISSVMGTLGGIVAYPRDNQLERQDTYDNNDFNRSIESVGKK